jgi:hypothetical protein
MLRFAIPVLLSALTLAVVAEETAPPQVSRRLIAAPPLSKDLAGTWLLTMSAGFEYEAVLEATEKPGEFRLRGAGNLNGVYVLRNGKLSIAEPDNEKMQGLVWDVLNRNVVLLTEHPESSQFGSDYRRSTLSRKKAEVDIGVNQFKPGAYVTVKPDIGDLVKPLTVELPAETPYPAGSREETLYLQGYAEGFARVRTDIGATFGDRATAAWLEGCKYGNRKAESAAK